MHSELEGLISRPASTNYYETQENSTNTSRSFLIWKWTCLSSLQRRLSKIEKMISSWNNIPPYPYTIKELFYFTIDTDALSSLLTLVTSRCPINSVLGGLHYAKWERIWLHLRRAPARKNDNSVFPLTEQCTRQLNITHMKPKTLLEPNCLGNKCAHNNASLASLK